MKTFIKKHKNDISYYKLSELELTLSPSDQEDE